jgi:integrase
VVHRPRTVESLSGLYRESCAIVLRHYRRPLTVAVVARALASSPRQLQRALVVLRLFLGHLREDGVIATNPAATAPGAGERIKLPAEHREMDYLRLDEIPLYLDAASETYRPLAEVLIACGLRISEAIGRGRTSTTAAARFG